MKMKVPFFDLKPQSLFLKEEIQSAIDEVFETQQFILGAQVDALEQAIAQYCQTTYAIGVASGSDALFLSLMALGIGPGDEVILPPFTFFATAGSVSRIGAVPVFVDIDPRTYNIDPSKSKKKSQRGRRPSSRSISSDSARIWTPFSKLQKEETSLLSKMRLRHWGQNITPCPIRKVEGQVRWVIWGVSPSIPQRIWGPSAMPEWSWPMILFWRKKFDF